ncbi:MAG: ABC transporter permease [Bacteroidales bacterium]|nr:ABC transporter permease [Bacteroidales bacterium]
MSKIGLIIEREYLTRVYKKSFIVMTLTIPLIFIALAAVPALLSQVKDSKAKNIAVIDETGKYGSVLKNTETYNFIPVKEISETPFEYYKDSDKDLYAILIINGDLIENPEKISIFSEKTITPGLKTDISSQLNPYLTDLKIASFNIPDLKDIIDESKVKIDINTVKWGETSGSSAEGPTETKSSSEVATALGFIFTFLIYMFIFAYGGMVMNGVMQEKTNRIVEVMVSSVKPFELMMGKIIGVALVGLTQFLLWVVIIGGGMMAFGIGTAVSSTDISALSQMDPAMTSQIADPSMIGKINEMIAGINFPKLIGMFVIYFIGGYLLYASIFAAIGSVVDQEADTQQFMIPVTMIILFAFYAAIYSIENPDGPLAFWCSIIPFTSPIVMMVRLPFDVPAWQLLLSIFLLFITFIGSTMLAAKIYRTGILMYGKKITWGEMIKWLRYKN